MTYYVCGLILLFKRAEIWHELIRVHPISLIPIMLLNIIWPIWIALDIVECNKYEK